MFDFLDEIEFDNVLIATIVLTVVAWIATYFLFGYWDSKGHTSMTTLKSQLVTYIGIPIVTYCIVWWQANKD